MSDSRASSKDIAKELADRADSEQPISAGEYRKLFIKGLAALLRETDSIAYRVREAEKRR